MSDNAGKSFAEQTVVSMFARDGRTYLNEAAAYLSARGLNGPDDVSIEPIVVKNHGLATDDGTPYPLEGWAFRIKGADGDLLPNKYLLRVCNYPDDGTPLDMNGKVWDARPKFLQTFKGPFLYFTVPFEQVVRAKVILLHEKITSAVLATKTLRIPSIAFSGCEGWSKGGGLNPELEGVIDALGPDAAVVVCFDGDIETNSNIKLAACRLKAAIVDLRPDIVVTFPQVPLNANGVGWDDWAMAQGPDLAARWIDELGKEGVVIDEVVPLGSLITRYGVSTVRSKSGAEFLEQTIDNYRRLLRYPRWATFRQDFSGDVYDGNEYFGNLDDMAVAFTCWLERSVCRGYGNKVNKGRIVDALRMWSADVQCSMALELLRTEAPATLDEARAAAEELLQDGLRSIGPMTRPEQVDTVLRCFRDIALRWSDEISVRTSDIQWVWSIIGPSGCGKSKFPEMLISGLREVGYRRGLTTQLEKIGSRASFTEYVRVARDNLVAIMDDYNAGEGYAKDVENELYQLTSTRTSTQRRMREEYSTDAILHAVYFLTTTDTNRQFLRSNEGSGERRFIPFEVTGHVPLGERLTGDRDVIARCGMVLLRWAAHGGTVEGVATEFSEKYIKNYIQKNAVTANLGELGINWEMVRQCMDMWYRPSTEDYRFAPGALTLAIRGPGKMTMKERHDIQALFLLCGAKNIGKGRVTENGLDVQKDTVFVVPGTEVKNFLDNLRAV